MIKLFTDDEFEKAKSQTKLKLQCVVCDSEFLKEKRAINRTLKGEYGYCGDFCSRKCMGLFKIKKIKLSCKECDKEVLRVFSSVQKNKTKNYFCNKSCKAQYENRNKKYGYNRSKIEIWIEEELKKLNIDVRFNERNIIKSGELDIFLPNLKLAFELNGIYHYKPIFGEEKFLKVKERDLKKIKECEEIGIELIVLDISKSLKFDKIKDKKYLDYIKKMIEIKITW